MVEKANGDILTLTGDIPVFENNQLFMISFNGVETQLPTEYTLKSAYPNPFNPTTNIEYGLPKDSFVSIAIYDIRGRMVDELINTNQLAGYHKLMWDAGTQASGLYFIKLKSNKFYKTKKVILVR